MEELRQSGVKFTEEDVVMVTKTKKKELVWLEKGNEIKGLKHIILRHEKNLKDKFGISKEDIPSFVKNVYQNGKELATIFKNGNKAKLYLYKGEYFVLSAIGTNGFIISIYPKSYEEVKKWIEKN